MSGETREKREQLARCLGLTLEELKVLRRQMGAAEAGLIGRPKAEKTELIARRLSITTGELKALRQSIATGTRTTAARLVAGHIVGLPQLRQSIPAAAAPIRRPAAAPTPKRPAGPAPPRRPVIAAPPKLFRDWNADTNVFVTTWGNAVHMYADCHGTRGFRHASEPDPVVFQARLRDPVCVDRRACRKCFDVWSPSTIDRLDDLLEDLHGKRRPPSRSTTKTRTVRPVVTSRTAKTKVAPGPGKAAKAERDRLAAAKLNITVIELRARRRAEHEANRAKKAR